MTHPGRRRRGGAALGAVLGLVLAAAAGAVLEVPELRGRVNDRAGLLAPEEARALESRLAAFERNTTHQIVVLTVPSLEGEAIEAFAIRVADAWQIGHEDLDNGVIVVVSAGDRRARIEVGYGLEGVIPDAVAARIVRERMIPRFRQDDMGGGIAAGVEALMAAARGEEIPAERRPARRDARRSPGQGGLLEVAFFMGIVGGMVGGVVGRRRPLLGSGVGGGLAGLAAYLLTGALLGGAVAAVMGAFMGASGLRGHGRGLALGGFGRGGFGGGGFGGGGGGFGGGGGGFGGGGASGSW